MSYVQFRDVGADLTPDVDRLTIDMPNDLKTWKEIVSRHPIVVLYVWRQSCNPCVMLKNRYEKWVHEIKQRYNDYNNTILFVKDCLDRDGPMPPEGTGCESDQSGGWPGSLRTGIPGPGCLTEAASVRHRHLQV